MVNAFCRRIKNLDHQVSWINTDVRCPKGVQQVLAFAGPQDGDHREGLVQQPSQRDLIRTHAALFRKRLDLDRKSVV